MTGPFRIHLPKYLTLLDQAALPSAIRDVLFNGIDFHPDEHFIGRLSIAVLEDTNFKGSKKVYRRRSYERVDQLIVQISLPSDEFEIIEVYPHTTLATGLADPELEVGISIEPTTGKFTISGTLKNLIRRKRHLIINTHTSEISQWAFQKGYLRDNVQFNLDILLRRRANTSVATYLMSEVKAQEGGRLIRATRKKVTIDI
jgi:hypothetical protein